MSLNDPFTGFPIVVRLRSNELYSGCALRLTSSTNRSLRHCALGMCQSNVESLSDDDFPNIDNPVRISSLQLQRALAFVVQS